MSTKNSLFCSLMIMILLASMIVSCTGKTSTSQNQTSTAVQTSTTSTAAVNTTSPVPLTGNWWDELGTPQYGGTFTSVAMFVNGNFAPDFMGLGGGPNNEPLFFWDWTVDPKIHPFQMEIVEPQYFQGVLAESWEQKDPQTLTVHLRKGVHWQDKAPTNGNELTSEDVQINYDMILGTGSGFTTPMPTAPMYGNVKRVVAVDKYTVEFQLSEASVWASYKILTGPIPGNPTGVVAKDWCLLPDEEKSDWKNATGTGPFILSDLVESVSMTLNRNPNYWGHDERYPENQLPYFDTFKNVVVGDMSTQLAALRTGKIEYVANQRSGPTWQQIQSLKNTNPEIITGTWDVDGYAVDLRCDKEPFSDIRVRKALNMAIDRKAIAKSVLGGIVDGTPCGLMNPFDKDWMTPYTEWPADLQETYNYNPDEAKRLLAEAGYPDGFSGKCQMSNSDSSEVLQVIKSYFHDIGVEIEIEVMDMPTFMNYCMAGKNDFMVFMVSCGMVWGPTNNIMWRTPSETKNFSQSNDETYNAMYQKLVTAKTMDEAKQITREADMYALQQYWAVNLFGGKSNVAWQPYMKGYSGQYLGAQQFYFARFWIDQELKTSMGR